MNTEDFGRVRAAFDAALKLSGAERAEYVADRFRAPGESELATLLREMLAGANPGFLDPPSPRTLGGAVDRGVPLIPGTQLGAFRLERPIGSGGMGDVWEARQEQPARSVALKILRGGLETARARARFGEEAEMLARLSHPGIARVFASGVLAGDGGGPRPWFAMELIQGARDLVSHARELPLERRLELLAEVADAVHHGHLRGIVHRDLKPDNLLVDRDGRVHVIDFGIARASSSDESQLALTADGETLGTLTYMSPEQALGNTEQIDLRSDVHALGVILYELLTGRSPWNAGETSWANLAREICEVDPPAPSRVVTGLTVELDWIVAHALAKEPGQRYNSAELFGEDLRRFLRHEPLRAGPPSLTYQAAKFVRRNRAWVTGGVVAAVLLVLGTIGTGWGWLESIERGEELEAAKTRSDRRANRATALNEFLNEMLRSANPLASGSNQGMTVGEMLDRAASRIGGAFPGRIDLEAEIRTLIGVSYDGQGRYESAVEQLTIARQIFLELELTEAIRASRLLATSTAHLGDWQEALELMRDAHARGERELSADEPELGALESDLAWILQETGQIEESVPLARRAMRRLAEAGPRFAHAAAAAAGVLARAHRAIGDDDATELAYRQCLELQRMAYGSASTHAGIAAGNLGTFLYGCGRAEDALVYFEEALRIKRVSLPPDHPHLATALYNLSTALQDLGRYEESEQSNLECLAILERTLGPDHPETADARGGLAFLYYDIGRFEEALDAFEEYAAFLEEHRGAGNRRTLRMRVRVAETRVRVGREPVSSEGESELRALHRQFVKQLGSEDELTLYIVKAAERAGIELGP